MRKLLAGCVLALALAAPAWAQERGSWSYAYVDGVATATQRDDDGRVTATLTCRPPTGDIIIHDYTLARHGRSARTSSVRIGAMAVNVPSSVEGRGRDRALVINLLHGGEDWRPCSRLTGSPSRSTTARTHISKAARQRCGKSLTPAGAAEVRLSGRVAPPPRGRLA